MSPTATAAPEVRGGVLLAIARAAIEEALGSPSGAGGRAARHQEPWLERPAATFVTLRWRGELRGCIGTLEVHRPLAEDVRANALAAAFQDPRFTPLEAAELPELTIDVSVLSPLEPLPAVSEEDLLRKLRPGVDGLVLSCGSARGTFLPQVWESIRTPSEFVRRLKEKAGLPARGWLPEMRFLRYTVDEYHE